MASTDLIAAIDIGAHSIKVGEFEINASGITMRRHGYAEFTEQITDENRATQIQAAIAKIKNERGITAKTAYLSLSAQMAFTKFVKLPPIGEDPVKVKQVIEFEAKQNVPFELSEIIWDYQIIPSADNSELDVMFVAVKNEIIDKVVAAVQACGMRPDKIDIATSSMYNAIRANRVVADGQCAMFLSIGSRCANLLFVEGNQFFSRNIPIAGFAITQQIAKEFGISIEEAEELKRRHGFVALGGAYEEPESEVAATISKIVRNVMTRLHGEINRSMNIFKTQQKGGKPLAMYLCGGSATMLFTENFFNEKLKMDIKYFNPFQNSVRLGPDVDRTELAEHAHLFAEVIGMALRVSECPVEVTLVPERVKKAKQDGAKMPFYYMSAAMAVLIPAVFIAGAWKQQAHYNSELDKNTTIVKGLKSFQEKIKKADEDAKAVEKKLYELKDLNTNRYGLINVINMINAKTPPSVWIASMTCSKGKAAEMAGAASSTVDTTETGRRGRASVNKRNTKLAEGVTFQNEIGAIEIEGYYITSSLHESPLPSDVMIEALRLKSDGIFSDQEKLTGIKDFKRSELYGNFAKFKAQLALIKPIGRMD